MAEFYRFELKEFNAASLNGTFQNLGSALSNAARYVHIWNTSDVDVYITANGTTNDFRVPSNGDLPIPSYTQHNTLNEASFVFKKGTQLQIKQVTAAGTGVIIVHIFT